MPSSPPSVRIIIGCSIREAALLLAESAGLCYPQIRLSTTSTLQPSNIAIDTFALEVYGRLSSANGKTSSSTPYKKELGSNHFLPGHSHIKWRGGFEPGFDFAKDASSAPENWSTLTQSDTGDERLLCPEILSMSAGESLSAETIRREMILGIGSWAQDEGHHSKKGKAKKKNNKDFGVSLACFCFGNLLFQ